MPKNKKLASLTNISLAYPAGNTAVANINLQLFEGEIVGLLGANGSGKTTLLKLLSGYISITSGDISLGTTNITEFNERMLTEFVTLVEQNPENQLAGPTVEDELARSCRLMGLRGRAIEENVTRVLRDLKMEDAREWFLDEISTGERRRVALGLSLLGNPKLLLLDEPMSDLDDEGISAAVEFLKTYRSKGTCILISGHKLRELLPICDRIAVLNKGILEYVNEPDNVLRNKKLLEKAGIDVPDIPALCLELEAAGILKFDKCPVNFEQAKQLIHKTEKPIPSDKPITL